MFGFVQGPWSKVIQEIARAAGRKAGQRVADDLHKVNSAIPKKPLKEKILELREDSGISHTYIEKLIEQSNNSYFLTKINNYLGDAKKTANLGSELRRSLLQKLNSKMDAVNKDELLTELLRVMKEKGLDALL